MNRWYCPPWWGGIGENGRVSLTTEGLQGCVSVGVLFIYFGDTRDYRPLIIGYATKLALPSFNHFPTARMAKVPQWVLLPLDDTLISRS